MSTRMALAALILAASSVYLPDALLSDFCPPIFGPRICSAMLLDDPLHTLIQTNVFILFAVVFCLLLVHDQDKRKDDRDAEIKG